MILNERYESMKSGILVFLVSLLLIVPPALAYVGNNQNNSKNSIKNEEDENAPIISPEPSVSPNGSISGWKNHGQYVSSIAKKHDDSSEVSEAAKSDIGKKNNDNDENENNELEEDENDNLSVANLTLTPTPIPTITSTPEQNNNPTPTPTPTPTPEQILPTVTPTPTISNGNLSVLLENINNLFSKLEDFINSLVKH